MLLLELRHSVGVAVPVRDTVPVTVTLGEWEEEVHRVPVTEREGVAVEERHRVGLLLTVPQAVPLRDTEGEPLRVGEWLPVRDTVGEAEEDLQPLGLPEADTVALAHLLPLEE